MVYSTVISYKSFVVIGTFSFCSVLIFAIFVRTFLPQKFVKNHGLVQVLESVVSAPNSNVFTGFMLAVYAHNVVSENNCNAYKGP